jgi:2-(1,2-epoxy-1,2-dihydrophenyl)acetyl-CoA isomerase
MGYASRFALQSLLEKIGTTAVGLGIEPNVTLASQAVAVMRDANPRPERVNPYRGPIPPRTPAGCAATSSSGSSPRASVAGRLGRRSSGGGDMSDLITYQLRDGVARIELNRPGSANVFDLDTTRAFAEHVQRAEEDNESRAVLVTGAGPRFCGGGDVTSFATAEDQPAYIHQLAIELDAAFQHLAALEKPVVAAVQGAVAGAGLALMLSCDVVVSAPGTKFVFAYPGIGLTPDCGLSYLLPRAVGQQRALQFALVGKPAAAAEALDWGLVTEVVDDSTDPVDRAAELAVGFAAGSATALGHVRRLLRSGWAMTREEVGIEEARTITEMVRGTEAQELIRSFVIR